MKNPSKETKRNNLKSDSAWQTGQSLDVFFSELNKIESSGISAIITRKEKKETDERDQGN